MSWLKGASRITDWGDSKTVASDQEHTDINKILGRYKASGMLPRLGQVEGRYMDVSEFSDLKDALAQASQAEAEFMQLPSKIREVFNHDVAEWLDTAHDPDKIQRLLDAGLITASPAERASLEDRIVAALSTPREDPPDA